MSDAIRPCNVLSCKLHGYVRREVFIKYSDSYDVKMQSSDNVILMIEEKDSKFVEYSRFVSEIRCLI